MIIEVFMMKMRIIRYITSGLLWKLAVLAILNRKKVARKQRIAQLFSVNVARKNKIAQLWSVTVILTKVMKMSNKSKEELERLVEIIVRYRDGISIEELLNLMNDAVPRRTVQYRLSILVKSGVLSLKGAGRSNKYYINPVLEKKQILEKTEISHAAFTIPLSIEGEDLRKLITSPIQLRRHVSYQREFLDSYEPNKTFYLSKPILEKLFMLGAGIDKGRPAGTYARTIYQRLLR